MATSKPEVQGSESAPEPWAGSPWEADIMRGPDGRVYIAAEALVDPMPCIHSVKRFDKDGCPSCTAHLHWYIGRLDGLKEAARVMAEHHGNIDHRPKAEEE